MKKHEGFNKPFVTLKDYSPKKNMPEPRNRPPMQTNISVTEEPDIAVFEKAVVGIKRIRQNRFEPEQRNPEDMIDAIRKSISSENEEVLSKLKNIVSGNAKFDIRESGEYVEGYTVTLEPSMIEKLKKGDFAVQAFLDLHGLIAENARENVESFIRNSYAMGYRCLLIIHGRGLKSPAGPVLKQNTIIWLTMGSMSRYVLAFCSARPCDGGTGAVYVLLKKRPDRKRIKRTA